MQQLFTVPLTRAEDIGPSRAVDSGKGEDMGPSGAVDGGEDTGPSGAVDGGEAVSQA